MDTVEMTSLQLMVLGKLHAHVYNNGTRSCLSSSTKCMKDLNVKHGAVKSLEEKHFKIETQARSVLNRTLTF